MSGFTHVNVGAVDQNGNWFPTKKAMKEELKRRPDKVTFIKTSMYEPDVPRHMKGNEVPDGLTLIVVGPNPWESRKWYASVKDHKVT